MRSTYDKFLTAAERVHVHLLRLLTVFLTVSMWLMALCLGAVWYQWAKHGFEISVIIF